MINLFKEIYLHLLFLEENRGSISLSSQLKQCSANFFHSRHIKTLFKFSRHTSAKSAENLRTKSAALNILAQKANLIPQKAN